MQERLIRPGRALGDFIVGDKLGEGGFGEVYRAQQRSLERHAVVKIMRRDRNGGSSHFLREAKLAAHIDHPYAAHIYAYGAEADGLLWIAMELVQGTPLGTLLQVRGALSVERFVPFFERLCEVVHAIHERGIVHRDIKPANIMVVSHSGRMTPKLIDLGIATYSLDEPAAEGGDAARMFTVDQSGDANGAITETQHVLGSPLYMAPEQWNDPGRVSARADLYALALVGYECVTGKPPFNAGSVADIRRAHQAETPSWPASLPPALGHQLLKSLAKSPLERHTDALALAASVRASSGLTAVVAPLPRLPAAIVTSVLERAPRPIADVVAALDAAMTLRQLRAALTTTIKTVVRYLGVVTLAARAALTRDAASLDPARSLLEQLARRPLSTAEWSHLVAALCHPLLSVRDAFAVPELLDFVSGISPGRDALAVLITTVASPPTLDDHAEHRALVQSLSDLAGLIRGIEFLSSYVLCVGANARWMGARTRASHEPEVDVALQLRGPDGDAVVDLGPLARVAAPIPGAEPELFVFDGRGARGAVMRSTSEMELAGDERIWGWLGERLMPIDAAPRAPARAVPYPGLVPFTTADAPVFFGRDGALATFRNRLRTSPLLAIVGASGSGKTSFALAGVAADLANESHVVVVRPGAAPLAALAASLATRLPNDRAEIERELANPEWLGRQLRALAVVEPRGTGTDADGRGTLLIVDQLEELFTMCTDPDQRRRFALAIAGAARATGEPVRVVVTLRHDFLPRAQELPGFGDQIPAGVFVLAAPSRAELLLAVTEPARRAGYSFDEAELPEQMIDEVAGRPGALPLLAFAAERLWGLRDEPFRVLRAGAYRSMGGVAGALVRHADATLGALHASEHARARHVFLRLVTADGTRATLTIAEAIAIAGGDERARRIVEALLGSRLIVSRDHDDGELLELAHEALVTEWPQLMRWREDERIDARLRDQVAVAARAWHARGRHAGLVWRNEALVDLERWLERTPRLTELEIDFVAASRAEASRGRRRRRAWLISGALATIAMVVVIVGFSNRAARERERSTALAQSAKAQRALALFERGRLAGLAGHSSAAALDLVRSIELGRDTPASRMMLADVLRPLRASEAILGGHRQRITEVSVSPDRTGIATASMDSTVRLWSSDGEFLTTLAHGGPVYAARFVPDGQRLVTTSADGRARLWDARGKLVQILDAGGPDVLFTVASPDSKSIATTTHDGKVRIWSAADGQLLRAVDHPPAFDTVWVAFQSNGLVLSGSDQEQSLTVTVVATGERLAAIELGTKIEDLIVTRRGFVVVAGADHVIRVLGPDRAVLASLSGHGDRITVMEVSPDGSRLASGDADGSVRIWDLTRLQGISELTRHPGKVNALAFSPSGNLVASAATESVRISDVRYGIDIARLDGHDGKVWSIAFLDERRMISGSFDGEVRIWDATPQRLVASHDLGTFDGEWSLDPALALEPSGSRALAGNLGAIVVDTTSGAILHHHARDRKLTAVAWSDHGQIACGDLQGFVHIGRVGAALRTVEISRDQPIARLAFSPDDQFLVVAAYRSLVRVVRLRDLSIETVSTDGGESAVTWSRDGSLALEHSGGVSVWRSGSIVASAPGVPSVTAMRFDDEGLVIGALEGSVMVLDPSTLKTRLELVGHRGNVSAIVRVRSGLLTASYDATARIWDWRGEAVATLHGHTDGILGAATLDLDFVATAGFDASLRIWDTGAGSELAVVRAHPGGVKSISATESRVVSTGADRALRIWRVDYDRRPIEAIAAEVMCLTRKRLNDHDTPIQAPPCVRETR